MEEKHYYKILGVPNDASVRDIKKAYKVLARKYSPGKNPGNEEWAEKRKHELIDAYEVLISPEARAIYDASLFTPVKSERPPLTPKNSPLPVRPAHVRTPAPNKKSVADENKVNAKVQQAIDKKKKRRNTIFTISAIVAVIAIVSVVFYSIVYVLPFQKVIIRVDDTSIKMDYLLRRVMMNSEGSTWDTIQTIINEVILAQEAPQYVGAVSDAEVDELMRTAAQGESESLTDVEYKNWLRLQLNVSQLKEPQFRDLFYKTILQSRMYTYLAERVSNVVPQVHLNYLVVNTYEEALAAKERIDAGEEFAVVTKEVSTDTALREAGGDVGWTPVNLLEVRTRGIVTDLPIGVCSIPIPLGEPASDTTTDASVYALVMILEKSDAMEVNETQLNGLQQVAYDDWLTGFQASKTITFHGIRNQYLDSETFSWISYQVARLRAISYANYPTE